MNQATSQTRPAPDSAAALVVARNGETIARRWVLEAGDRLTSGQLGEFDRTVRNQFQVARMMLLDSPNDPEVDARAWSIIRAALAAWEGFRATANRQSTRASRGYASLEEAATEYFNMSAPVLERVERAAGAFGAGFGAIALIGGAVLFFSRRRS